MRGIEELQERIEYTFKDEQLLINALTHSSYTSEHGKSYRRNNERLEFIGDAYLGAVIGKKLYGIMCDSHEGVLSRKRAEIVCKESLADVAKGISLGDYIFLGRGEDMHNGRENISILADAMEAVIGAVMMDGGYEACQKLVLSLFFDKIRLAVKGELIKDYKSELQQKFQQKYHENMIEYVLIKDEGPAHDKTFTVELRHNGETLATGVGKSKLKAEQSAAQYALSEGKV